MAKRTRRNKKRVKRKRRKTRKVKRRKTRKKKIKGKKPTIGILTVPLSPNKKFFSVCGDSYISESHIGWLKRNGINVVAIPFTTKKHKLWMKRVNGLYFPSGGAFAVTQHEYYKGCKQFLKLAMKENDKGNHFPIWGGCMGMQQMMIIAEGSDNLDNLLQRFDSYKNLMCTLELTEDGRNSTLIRTLPENFVSHLQKKKCTLNNHKMGLTPLKFKKHKALDGFFKIVSISKDRKNRKFVSTIEGRHYPFYGVQWHPERDYVSMNELAKFLKNELRKNGKRAHGTTRKLYSKVIDCWGYSDSLYKKCKFYWHKKTSKHNRKLCNAAQIEKKTPDQTGV
jgi:gamma-glutamyl-gamma-aminobutyrate hydrolase PuuD